MVKIIRYYEAILLIPFKLFETPLEEHNQYRLPFIKRFLRKAHWDDSLTAETRNTIEHILKWA